MADADRLQEQLFTQGLQEEVENGERFLLIGESDTGRL